MAKNIKIKQKHYGTIEIDNKEKDIVMIWCRQGNSNEVIQVERKNIPALIVFLTQIEVASHANNDKGHDK
jgi:hypothetical protein